VFIGDEGVLEKRVELINRVLTVGNRDRDDRGGIGIPDVAKGVVALSRRDIVEGVVHTDRRHCDTVPLKVDLALWKLVTVGVIEDSIGDAIRATYYNTLDHLSFLLTGEKINGERKEEGK
jgi:hypothetical protein